MHGLSDTDPRPVIGPANALTGLLSSSTCLNMSLLTAASRRDERLWGASLNPAALRNCFKSGARPFIHVQPSTKGVHLLCRGSTCTLPVDTLEAFQKAISEGADFVAVTVVRSVLPDATFTESVLACIPNRHVESPAAA